ncbi:hypothetical protein BJ741DRAFT_667965 [Chytriomyces cf. hyalinus JEL632]|nr:hypothetical protein BJ741DRAFT_667965 [Chytriomyces cf. hyalinus JEL632]
MNWFREKSQDARMKKERDALRLHEQTMEENLRIEQNRLRRENELRNIENTRIAQQQLAMDNQRMALLQQQSALEAERHRLKVAEQNRASELYQRRENGIDQGMLRQQERDRIAREMREAARKEEEMYATERITITDNFTMENGVMQASGQNVQRIRQANTNAEAALLMASIQAQMDQLHQQQPAITNSSSTPPTMDTERVVGYCGIVGSLMRVRRTPYTTGELILVRLRPNKERNGFEGTLIISSTSTPFIASLVLILCRRPHCD